MKHLLLILMCVSSTSWATVIIFDYDKLISFGEVYDEVVIKGEGTTVQLVGGSINTLVTMDSAVFNMTSGAVGTIYSHDESHLYLTRGTVGNLYGYGNSIMELYGTVDYQNVTLKQYSVIEVSETSTQTSGGIELWDNSTANISEGNILDIIAWQSSICNLRGGSIAGNVQATHQATLILSGGTITGVLSCQQNTNIIIIGNDITKLPYTTSSVELGEVTGYWESGEFFSMFFDPDTYDLIKTQSPSSPLCMAPPSVDLDDDCLVNMSDLQMLASGWLLCGLEPQSACWE